MTVVVVSVFSLTGGRLVGITIAVLTGDSSFTCNCGAVRARDNGFEGVRCNGEVGIDDDTEGNLIDMNNDNRISRV